MQPDIKTPETGDDVTFLPKKDRRKASGSELGE